MGVVCSESSCQVRTEEDEERIRQDGQKGESKRKGGEDTEIGNIADVINSA